MIYLYNIVTYRSRLACITGLSVIGNFFTYDQYLRHSFLLHSDTGSIAKTYKEPTNFPMLVTIGCMETAIFDSSSPRVFTVDRIKEQYKFYEIEE